MQKEVLDCLSMIETLVYDAVGMLESWKNLKEQLESVEKLPPNSALLKFSPHHKSKLIGRLEVSINELQENLSERMCSLEKCAAMISDFKIKSEALGQKISFTFADDAELLLKYLREESAKWFERLQYEPGQRIPQLSEPEWQVKCAIQRLKHDLAMVS